MTSAGAQSVGRGGECARMLVCTTGLTRRGRGVEEEGLFTTPMLHCGSSSL